MAEQTNQSGAGEQTAIAPGDVMSLLAAGQPQVDDTIGQLVVAATFDPNAFDVSHDGLVYVGLSLAELTERGVPEAAILTGLKRSLAAQVDARAEQERLRWITPGSGQAQEYQEVRAQAQAALADPANATAELYPMLAGTIGIDFDPETKAPATDILGVARGVVEASKAWLAVGTHIRVVRDRKSVV